MDYYIRTRNTGSPVEFATKIGISERSLYEYINTLKDLGAPVAYCYCENSYIYYEEGKLSLSFSVNDPAGLCHIRGNGTSLQINNTYFTIPENLTLLQNYCRMSFYF